jgi:hypothetical protein
VTVGKIRLNPYTLRLEVDQLHIAERDGKTPFIDIGHLHVNAAWSSVFRRAPVIEELTVDAPRVRIVRTAEQRFNFSDILDRLNQPEVPPKPKSTEPVRSSSSTSRWARSTRWMACRSACRSWPACRPMWTSSYSRCWLRASMDRRCISRARPSRLQNRCNRT